MRAASRTASIRYFFSSSTPLFPPSLPCPNPNPIRFSPLFLFLRRTPPSSLRRFSSTTPPPSPPSSSAFDFVSSPAPFIEKQFDVPLQRKEARLLRQRIWSVVREMKAPFSIPPRLVFKDVPIPVILEETKAQIEELKGPFGRLAEILKECPDQYYRFHSEWSFEMRNVVSLLAFVHLVETGNLLLRAEAEKKLGLDSSELHVDIEDHLAGLCLMAHVLRRYVINQTIAGEYDCQRKALGYLSDLRAALTMLDLEKYVLREKPSEILCFLLKVEIQYYDIETCIDGYVTCGTHCLRKRCDRINYRTGSVKEVTLKVNGLLTCRFSEMPGEFLKLLSVKRIPDYKIPFTKYYSACTAENFTSITFPEWPISHLLVNHIT